MTPSTGRVRRPASNARASGTRASSARRRAAAIDHAGSVLCRLLMSHPDVMDIELLGQAELIEGTITYSLGVFLPDGRELYIDVEDAPRQHRDPGGDIGR